MIILYFILLFTLTPLYLFTKNRYAHKDNMDLFEIIEGKNNPPTRGNDNCVEF